MEKKDKIINANDIEILWSVSKRAIRFPSSSIPAQAHRQCKLIIMPTSDSEFTVKNAQV